MCRQSLISWQVTKEATKQRGGQVPGSLDRLGKSHESWQVMDAGKKYLLLCYRCMDMGKQGKLINERLNILLFILRKTESAVFCEYDG